MEQVKYKHTRDYYDTRREGSQEYLAHNRECTPRLNESRDQTNAKINQIPAVNFLIYEREIFRPGIPLLAFLIPNSPLLEKTNLSHCPKERGRANIQRQ